MLTPRNHIGVSNNNPDTLIAMDTLYEIADAEFASSLEVNAMWDRLAAKHVEFRGLFTHQICNDLTKIAVREDIIHHLGTHPIQCVATRIAQDWWAAEGKRK